MYYAIFCLNYFITNVLIIHKTTEYGLVENFNIDNLNCNTKKKNGK